MAQQADSQPEQPQPLPRQLKPIDTQNRRRSAGTGSQIATISSKFETPQQQQPTPKRPGHAPRASSTSSKRLSASILAGNTAATPAKPSPSQAQTTPTSTTPPNSEDNSAAPGALRRSLSFKLPIRVSTDNNNLNFPPAAANRSRASSLPQDSEPTVDRRRHSTQRSLSSIVEAKNPNNTATTTKVLEVPQADSPKPSPKSPSKQFLLERGLLNPEELQEISSPEELQTSLQDQVVKYLTTMSSP